MDNIYKEIKRVQDSGLNPDNYLIENEGEMLSLVQVANNLVVRYREQMAKAAGEEEGCAAAVAPANLLVNGFIKAYGIWVTSGLALLLPDRMTNVDVGEIAHGKPVGNKNAIVPEVREMLLDGDNSTIANIIRDPVRCIITFKRKC